MKTVAIKNIGECIINRDDFHTVPRTIENYGNNRLTKENASSMFTRTHHEDVDSGASLYIVYSYGYHFPIVMYDYTCERWYMNMDKNSSSTNKHRTLIQQSFAKHYMSAIASDTEEMTGIDNYGSTASWVIKKAS
jgi:hypothetical protein|tara:strand:+ start:818 stop:1222 length:405 start_codon:yes stop_codon:yes gene_type:complete